MNGLSLPTSLRWPFAESFPMDSPLSPIAVVLVGSLSIYGIYRTVFKRKIEQWDPENELVLITGGSSGIGKQLVEDLCRKKNRVIIFDIQQPEFELPEDVHFYHVDITSAQAIAEVASVVRKAHGDPTVLINNAGVFYHGTILESPEREFRQTFDVNVIAHFLLVKEFLPSMVRRNKGHVVTMASIASFVAVGEMVDYCCSKASILAFHEGLTQELKHFYNAPNVRTTIVHPLWVQTPMVKGFTDYQSTFGQPVMTPKTVSKRVIDQILFRQGGQIILPTRLSLVSALRGMPISVQEMARSSFSKIVYRVRNVRAAAKDE
ncbi:uncharacterized protein N7483_012625 [Penicillium malachiteum]|uniref:uncharacterized protein n=1 Tax=Penicillium malachiteum TaxID=1324776 RepID=UPI002547352B|nr:uncharacterized protein N7483_012625 [Penicillium malachiteum]KAJ5715444.1 hypothetical protein N7483_012625 [Penicillium malachiteum]